MKATTVLIMVLILGIHAAAQEDRRPRPVRSDVRILIEESPEGDFDHEYYEQALPVEVRSGPPGLRSSVWFRTVCRPQEEDRSPVWIPARTPTSSPTVPLSVSAAASVPRFRAKASPAQIRLITGSARNDPATTPTTTPPPTGPTFTKPALFGGGGEDDRTSSDAPILYGPDFDLVMASDVRGLPEGTSLHLFARALFGSVEMFGTPTDLQLYAVGPRLRVPLAKAGSLELGLTVSAGPAFLHSAVGDAVGFDGGVGLRLEQVLAPTVSFVAAAEANLYFSEHVTSFGPVIHLGFDLAW